MNVDQFVERLNTGHRKPKKKRKLTMEEQRQRQLRESFEKWGRTLDGIIMRALGYKGRLRW